MAFWEQLSEEQKPPNMRQIRWLVLHCTASPQHQTLKVIQNYWKSIGFKKPGYHHLIAADGTVHNLQPIELPTNGVAGFNANSIHISYIGGVASDGAILDNRTTQQKQRQKELVIKYHAMFPEAVILGHRDFSKDKDRDGIIEPHEWMKACPSFSVKEWLFQEGILNTPKQPVVKKVVDTVSNSGVNLRSGPGTQYDIVASIEDSTSLIVLKEQSGWTNVQVEDDLIGWVKSEYLK